MERLREERLKRTLAMEEVGERTRKAGQEGICGGTRESGEVHGEAERIERGRDGNRQR